MIYILSYSSTSHLRVFFVPIDEEQRTQRSSRNGPNHHLVGLHRDRFDDPRNPPNYRRDDYLVEHFYTRSHDPFVDVEEHHFPAIFDSAAGCRRDDAMQELRGRRLGGVDEVRNDGDVFAGRPRVLDGSIDCLDDVRCRDLRR